MIVKGYLFTYLYLILLLLITDILHKKFHLSNCLWMSTDDCNIYHYRYNNNELIYEGC